MTNDMQFYAMLWHNLGGMIELLAIITLGLMLLTDVFSQH